MDRREFLKLLSLGIATSWGWTRLIWPISTDAGNPPLRLALLSDAHLKTGDPTLPEARLLARAVAEIKAVKPAPDLVLFAGDLAHDGDAQALALGKEILSDLTAPILAVRGEGDGPPDGSTAWSRLFGDTHYFHRMHGLTIICLDTALQQTARGPAFCLGQAQCRWLVQELRRLDPDLPLIILSHAPLTPIYQPWQQWTQDAHRLAPLLARFRQVLCLHGHVHGAGVGCQGSGIGARCQVSGVRDEWPVGNGKWPKEWSVVGGQWSETNRWANFFKVLLFNTENRKPKTENRLNLPLPATAWPLPSPLQGTPRRLTPGLAPRGCGWGLIALGHAAWDFQPRLWQA